MGKVEAYSQTTSTEMWMHAWCSADGYLSILLVKSLKLLLLAVQ